MAQPTDLPRWSTDVGTTTEPTEDKKDEGFVVGEKPAAQTHNWLFNTIYLWCDYLKNLTSEALTWTAKQTFSLSPVAPFFEFPATASLSHGSNGVGPKNRIIFAGRAETTGGLVTKYAFGCTFSLESSNTVLRVAFGANYTELSDGNYLVLMRGPSETNVGSGAFTLIRTEVYDRTGTGFRVSVQGNSVNLTTNTIGADVSQPLTSFVAADGFEFIVLGNLVNYGVTV